LTISGNSSGRLSVRLTRIDELYRSQHHFLTPEDDCYFLGEYTPGAGYAHSATNDLIANFKKPPDRRDTPEWPYKRQAVARAAAMLAAALDPGWLAHATLVPMPPSAARGDPAHDPRLAETLADLERTAGRPLDIRELLVQAASTRSSSRSGGDRLSLAELRAVYRIDASLAGAPPRTIGLFDDLITSGAHFRVAQEMLRERFPHAWVSGIFLARCLHLPAAGRRQDSATEPPAGG
jgi:hypothetical protein